MKAFFWALLFFATPCSAQEKTTPGGVYIQKEFTLVSSGTETPQNTKLLIICYNKQFNQDKFNSDFLQMNRLDLINYTQNMSVEIFLGQVKEKVVNLKIDKIEENDHRINIYYSFEISKSTDLSNTLMPFVIVETPISRKQVVFYENGTVLNMPGSNIFSTQ